MTLGVGVDATHRRSLPRAARSPRPARTPSRSLLRRDYGWAGVVGVLAAAPAGVAACEGAAAPPATTGSACAVGGGSDAGVEGAVSPSSLASFFVLLDFPFART